MTRSTNVGDQGPEMAEMWMLRLERSDENRVRREVLISMSEFGGFAAAKGDDCEWAGCSVCVSKRLGIVERWSTEGL